MSLDYRIYIDTGSGYTQFTSANLEGVSISRKRDNFIFARDSVNGSIKFYGDEASTLTTESATANKLDAYITYGATTLVSGYISLLGDYNLLENTCELEFVVVDQYTTLVDKFKQEVTIPVDNDDSHNLVNRGVMVEDLSISKAAMVVACCSYKLESLIEYVVGQLDNTIGFDANSWSYLWSKTNYDKIYISPFNNTLIEDQSDFALEPWKVTLEKLILWFETSPLSMSWDLELVSGTYYFRLKHKSELNYSLGTNPDLTAYKSYDWAHDKQAYTFNKETRFTYLKRQVNASLVDFIGRDVYIPSLDSLSETRTVSLQDYNTDVTDVFIYNPDKYSGFSEQQYLLTCADDYKIFPITPGNYMYLGASSDYIGGIDSNVNVIAGATSVIITLNNNVTDHLIYLRPIIQLPFTTGDTLIPGTQIKTSFTIATDLNTCEMFYADGASDAEADLAWPKSRKVVTSGAIAETYVTNKGPQIQPLGLCFYLTGTAGQSLIIQAATGSYAECGMAVCLEAASILEPTPTNVENADLALSRLDATFNTDKLPDTPAFINGTSTTVTVEKKYKTNIFKFPANSQNTINFNELVKTELGNIEAQEFTVYCNGQMAQLTGLL